MDMITMINNKKALIRIWMQNGCTFISEANNQDNPHADLDLLAEAATAGEFVQDSGYLIKASNIQCAAVVYE